LIFGLTGRLYGDPLCAICVSKIATARYVAGMSLVRILVDGYSLLHNWPQLAPGRMRHSAAARVELIHVLTRYQDAVGTPITVFFDGSGAPPNVPKNETNGVVEVLFSGAGQTADDMIERAAHRFQPYGQIMAVTDDNAERDIVIGLGGHACSCENFVRMMESEMADFQDALKRYNRTEQNRYRNAP
jgi:predicted RNA-binding protein with PIN domain